MDEVKKVTADTVTAEEVEQMTAEQVEKLGKGEEVEVAGADKQETEAPEPAGEQQQGAENPGIEAIKAELRADMEAEYQRKEKGILYDLQSERQKRQQAEARIQELSPTHTQQADEAIEFGDDDFISGAELKKYVGNILEQGKASLMAELERKERDRRIAISAEEARNKHKDYDDVVMAFSDMVMQDNRLLDIVLTSDNPGERAYQEGLKHPKFQAKIDEEKRKKDIIETIKNRPKTIIGGGGGAGNISLEKAASMSEAEWAALPEDVRRKLLEG